MTTTPTTKFTGLTGLNVDALQKALDEKALPAEGVVLGKTVATFPWDADETLTRLRWAKEDLTFRHGSRQHPVASLHAVIRKAAKAAGN